MNLQQVPEAVEVIPAAAADRTQIPAVELLSLGEMWRKSVAFRSNVIFSDL